MIGAFYQPLAVLADTATLNTLDERQLAAGIAEVIKYGLIVDSAFFSWLEQNMDRLLSLGASRPRPCYRGLLRVARQTLWRRMSGNLVSAPCSILAIHLVMRLRLGMGLRSLAAW